ncbi:site-specific integrase [Rhizobium sp. Leaf306]|uniref:site-specific integrase n=1 Tax=Rhizobium sp. Leaf306 TaxID=1736330 RepID=UPI000AAB2E1F|nr:site-specific integrase [Rhizobium sp. Leaf306]
MYTRDGRYYVRRRVPAELRQAVGREFLITSLKTSDFKEASRKANHAIADHQKLLDEAGGRLHPQENSRNFDDLTAHELEKIVTDWFSTNYRAAALAFSGGDLYVPEPDEVELPGDLEHRRLELNRNVLILTLPNSPHHEQLLRGAIEGLARANGIAIRRVKVGPMQVRSEITTDRAGWRYKLFFDLVRRGVVELMRQEIADLAVIPMYIADPELHEVIHSPTRRSKRTVTLAELIEEFKADPNRKDMRKKVDADYSLLFRVMDEVIGYDRRLRDIERDDCKAVRDLLLRLPANSTKLYRGMSFAEAADRGSKDGRKVLSPVTVNSYVHKMSALFNYAVVEEGADKNPARKLGLEGHEHGEEDRHPFAREQLEKIFSAPIYTGCQDDERNWAKVGKSKPKRTKFWVPLIGLYQGMRLNEICQLRTEDIQSESGIYFFNIKPDIVFGKSKAAQGYDDGGRRTKTASARRRVPVHPTLQELGFSEFVAARREAGNERLFPDLKKDSRGYFSDGFQKWFSRLLEKQGAKKEKTSFHSFRHNWADSMRLAGVPQERRRLIGGWKKTATDEKYGSSLPITALYDEISKISYQDIKTTHLL